MLRPSSWLFLLSAVSLSVWADTGSIVTCPSSCRDCHCCSVLNATAVTSLQLSVDTGCRSQPLVQAPCGCGDGQDAAYSLVHSHDCLREVPASLSQFLPLVRLVLSRNQIQTLTSLPSADTLIDLDLSYNLIASLPGDLLVNATRLRHLNLSFNKITIIAPGFFHEGLTSLKVVDLSHNQLTQAEAWPMMLGPFCRFDLSHNLITGFSNANNWTLGDAGEGTVGPGFVNLSHNQFQRWFLEDLSMYGFSSVWSLFRLVRWGFDLRGNPWHCDCSVTRVLSVFQLLARLSPRDYFSVTCHSPPELAGRTVLSLSVQEFTQC